MALKRKQIIAEIKRAEEKLKVLEPGTEEYDKTLESIGKLSGLTDRTELDVWISRAKTIIETTASIAIPVWMVLVAMVFEKSDNITTKFGNFAVNKCLSFANKKN